MLQKHRFLRIVMHLRVQTIVNNNENAPSWNRKHTFFKNIEFYDAL